MRVSLIRLAVVASSTVLAWQLVACGSEGSALDSGTAYGGEPCVALAPPAVCAASTPTNDAGTSADATGGADANQNGGPIEGGVGGDASRSGDPSRSEGGPSDDSGMPTMVCGPDAGTISFDYSDPAVAEVWSGMGSSVADSCDSSGNLVKHSCAVAAVTCAPAPNPGCIYGDTGGVKTWQVDCAGHCVDGACPSRCPQNGDAIAIQSVDADGGVTVTDGVDGRRFACSLTFDQPNDNFDCSAGVRAGAQAMMTSQGLSGTYCTGADFGNIGLCFPAASTCDGQNCTYACSVAP